MLVLSRKLEERIVVPHCQSAVTIVSMDGGRVRLGFSAPAEIAVYRARSGAKSATESTAAAWESKARVGTEMTIREWVCLH